MQVLLQWLDSRTGYKQLLNEALYEPIPGGARWRYVWGSTLTFVFVIQVITGFFLWSAYSPSTMTAWESVYYIQNEMTYGWLVRGIHHFAAQAMMILLALHFMQVIIDGAYRAPREVNFWLGLVLLKIVLGLSLTGYLLPWDQKGYYATQVATNIAGVTPVIGQQVQQLAQGGPNYGHHTLTRFFVLHAGVLPTLLVGFLALHIYVFRRHGICVPKSSTGPTAMFWPDQVLKDAVACLAVLVTILAFAVMKGAELTAPADPGEQFPARPEWYFLFLFRFLEIEAVNQMGLAFGAIYVPGAVMLLIALMPIIGNWDLGHRFNVGFIFVLFIGVAILTGLAIQEDQHNAEFQAALKFAERDAHRVAELAKKQGIPAGGARELLASDPYTQGPRLFARNCASCHFFEGHDATGKQLMVTVEENGKKQTQPALATAADLGQFGTREWMRSVLLDYENTFSPIKYSLPKEAGDKFLAGDMAQWSKDNQEVLKKPENKPAIDALIEFLVSQSGRKDITDLNADLVTQGRAVFAEGKLPAGTFTVNCGDCHSLKVGDDVVSEAADTGAPTLTGYAGHDWLDRFITDPAHADFYGEKNLMSAFPDAKLSPKDRELLVKWMTGNYDRSEHKAIAKTGH